MQRKLRACRNAILQLFFYAIQGKRWMMKKWYLGKVEFQYECIKNDIKKKINKFKRLMISKKVNDNSWMIFSTNGFFFLFTINY